jgi:hypothetical protein
MFDKESTRPCQMTSLSPDWHTQIGNNYSNWTSSAQVLFAASSVLTRERNAEDARILNSTDATPVSVAILTLPAELMLTAFAIEALLKALWLKKGNKLVHQGKYTPLPCEQKRQFHNLAALCDNVGFILREGERIVLDILSSTGRFKGRYPIARRSVDMRSIFFWSHDYDKVTGELVTRLWRTLGISLDEVPIGGLPISDDAQYVKEADGFDRFTS